jgi:hypothetical protein
MAAFDDLMKGGNALAGLAVLAAGAVILAPVVAPALASAGRPLAKSALKAGLLIFERGRETAAELGEIFEDMLAEVKAEMEAEQTLAGAATAGSAAEDTEAAENTEDAEDAEAK